MSIATVPLAFGALALTAATASADISKVIYTIKAESSMGTASAEWLFEQGTWNPVTQTYFWNLTSPKELIDPNTNQVIATVQQANTFILNDPQVNVGFLVQAGNVNTTFEITSALLSFPTIPNADGKATAQMGITDLNGDGATLTGLYAGNSAYNALYNGTNVFSSLIGMIAASPGGSGNAFQNDPPVGFKPVGANVSDMSARIKFSLTAFDTASGTSNFQIVPEPASFLVLAFGAMALFRRR
jgi:hypothetical protein